MDGSSSGAVRRSPRPALGRPRTTALVLPRPLLEGIRQRAVAEAPREVCGLLVGRPERGRILVHETLFMENLSAADDGFVIGGTEYAEALRSLTPERRLVGVFHSHEGDPRPSGKDWENMQLARLVWLIVDPTSDPPSSLALQAGASGPEPLRLELVDDARGRTP